MVKNYYSITQRVVNSALCAVSKATIALRNHKTLESAIR